MHKKHGLHSNRIYTIIQDVSRTQGASSGSQLERPFQTVREEIIGSEGVWGDVPVHSSGQEKAQWTAEVFGKCRGNMMV